jgi:energy-coupling factor transporter transmembrane protein EcfT
MLENEKKNLKIFGGVFIFLGIWDIVWPIISYFLGKYNFADMATQANVSEEVIKVALIVIAIVVVIFAIIKILIGVGSINKAEGKENANMHPGLCKLIMVLNIIALIALVPSLFTATADIYSVCDSLATVLMIAEMLKYNKELSK